jgi:hypothetical protein
LVAEAFLLTRDPFVDWEFSIAKLAIELLMGWRRSVELKAGDGWSCFPLSADVDAAGMCAKNADGRKIRKLASKLTRAPTRKPWQKTARTA